MQQLPVRRQQIVRFSIRLILAVFLIPACAPSAAQLSGIAKTLPHVQDIIRHRLTEIPPDETLSCQGERLCGIRLLPRAYRNADYAPLWIDGSFTLSNARSLVEAIAEAKDDGLDPQDYHLSAIRQLLGGLAQDRSTPNRTDDDTVSASRWADLDLLLTDAFLLFGSHLAAGRVDPETLHPDWIVDSGPVDLLAALKQATFENDIIAALESLRPTFEGYQRLREALKGLRALAESGGWPQVPYSETLRAEDHNGAVAGLRRRLVASGDLPAAGAVQDETYFDPALVHAVKGFQRRHGLTVDGVVGRATYGMLNVPIDQRIRQAELNLERWRWLPRDLGQRHIMINTADFNLEAVAASDQVALTMRVIVGRPARRSPVFSARMSYMVINPYWNVPRTIAVEDLLPKVREDATYLTQHGIRVYASWQEGAPQLDPTTIDWQAYDESRFPFRLRQDPGPYNALGRIKFMLPNAFAVYLHDTPNRNLFKRTQRDVSSGCIRVEKPLELAAFALADDLNWPLERIKAQVDSGETKTIRISEPLTVHLLYMTAWVDDEGHLQYRGDIYRRDRALQHAFDQRRPDPPPGSISDTDAPETKKGNSP